MIRSAFVSGRMGLALAGSALLTVAVLLPSRAEAQFGIRGGPVGVARFAVGHMLGLSRLRHSRMAVRGSRYRSTAMSAQDPRQNPKGAERGQPANPYVDLLRQDDADRATRMRATAISTQGSSPTAPHPSRVPAGS